MRTKILQLVGVVGLVASLVAPGISHAVDKPRSKKIVLIAGPITGHSKNTHEYEKSVILLKDLLDTSPSLEGAKTEAH